MVLARVKSYEGGFGFNAVLCEYGDLLAAGIVDPVMVVRTALQKAASVAGTLLTAEGAIVDLPAKAVVEGTPRQSATEPD